MANVTELSLNALPGMPHTYTAKAEAVPIPSGGGWMQYLIHKHKEVRVVPLKFTELSPAETEINSADMKATATTQYASPIIDLTQSFVLTLALETIAVGAGTVGAAKIFFQRVDKEGNAVGDEVTIITAIDTFTAGTQTTYVSIGGGLTADKIGNGTLDGNIDNWRVIGRGKFVVEVTTASDSATSSVASLRVEHK